MIHPSSLLFFDGQFETVSDHDDTDVPVHTILPNFPDPEARVKRTPHEDEEFDYLAKSALNTDGGPVVFGKSSKLFPETPSIFHDNVGRFFRLFL